MRIVEDYEFEEWRDYRGIEWGDEINCGSKGVKFVNGFDEDKLIVVDWDDDLGSNKGSFLYPSSVKKIISKHEEDD